MKHPALVYKPQMQLGPRLGGGGPGRGPAPRRTAPFQVEGESNRRGLQMEASSNNRKENPMAQNQVLTEEWLAQNQQQMIRCPRQPGNLIISQKACFIRYRFGQRQNLNNFVSNDFFDYKFKKGLSLCRRCPIGKKLADSHPGNGVKRRDYYPRRIFKSKRRAI